MIRISSLAFACLLFAANSAWATDDIIGFLLARHLLVDGVVDSTWREVRQSGPHWATMYRIGANQPLFGTAEGSTLDIASLGGGPQVQKGFRVIGYADRLPLDANRLWGGIEVIGWRPGPVQHEMIDSLHSRSRESGFTAFNEADGVAMVRLKAWSKSPTGRHSYSCDSLGWVIATSARVPSTIAFSMSGECHPETAPGDTLLIPVVRGSMDLVMNAQGCLRCWKLKNGFLPGFGVPLAEFDRAIEHDHGKLKVRPFLRPR